MYMYIYICMLYISPFFFVSENTHHIPASVACLGDAR